MKIISEELKSICHNQEDKVCFNGKDASEGDRRILAEVIAGVEALEAELSEQTEQLADLFSIAYFDGAGVGKNHMQVLKDGVRDLMAERDELKWALDEALFDLNNSAEADPTLCKIKERRKDS